jgi:non-ribosomal peptide synthetase component E (peptide arylation enzyme)
MPLSGNPLDAPLPIPHLLRAGLASQPDSIALVSAATRWTWHELEARTNNLAANLLELGLRPGGFCCISQGAAFPVSYGFDKFDAENPHD